MSVPPAPSFLSFPELDAPPPPPPPPSFSSFPDLEPPSDKEKPSKRPRHDDSSRRSEYDNRDDREPASRRWRSRSPPSSSRHRLERDRHYERDRDKDRDQPGERGEREREKERNRSRQNDEWRRGDKDRHRLREARPSSSSKHHTTKDAPTSSSRQHELKPELPALKEQESFFKDGRGDEANVRFGSLDRYKIAKFYRSGAGTVIGLPPGLKITKQSSRENGKTLEVDWGGESGNRAPARITDRASRAMLNNPSRVLLLPSASSPGTFLPPYVALPGSKRPNSPPLPAESTYRSIFPASQQADDSDADASSSEGEDPLAQGIFGALPPSTEKTEGGDDDIESEEETYDSIVRTKNLYYSQKTKADPMDVSAWLAWARFSATAGFPAVSDPSFLAAKTSSSSARPLASTLHGRAEITLIHLTRALEQHPALAESVQFMLALLEAATEVEPAEKVGKRWDEALRNKLGGDIAVWRAWGSWKMSERESGGGGGNVTAAWAEEGLARLRGLWQAAESKSSVREEIEGIEVYLLLRACLALKEAGYPERALAIFQAQIELIFYVPERIALWPFEEILGSLEDFWDSEAPRFGEDGAQGWASASDASSQEPPPPFSPPPFVETSSDDPFTRWMTSEIYASSAVLSSRTSDEAVPVGGDGLTDEDDPFRLVLFSDVRPLLFPIGSPTVRPFLIYSLFTFLNLPFTPPGASTSEPFYSDAFLHNELAYSDSLRARFWPDHLQQDAEKRRKFISDGGMEPEMEAGVENPWECPVRAWPVGVESLFRRKGTGFTVLERGLVHEGLKGFTSNALNQIRKLYVDPLFALYALSFEAVFSPKAAIKLAKTILAERRDSLELWDGYARLERQRGKTADARKVYVTALSMSSDDVKAESAQGMGDAWKLWRGWIDMEWEEGEMQRATAVLIAAAGPLDALESHLSASVPDDPPTPVQILRTRQFFGRAISAALIPSATPSLARNAVHLIHLSALFTYLTTRSLPAVSEVYTQSTLFPTSSLTELDRELLTISQSSLLYRHMTMPSVQFRPAEIRANLERAIEAFPKDIALLSIYAATEGRMRYQNRVRGVLEHQVLSREEDVSGWVFAIWLELRMVKGHHNEHAVRSLFERAFDRPGTKHYITLWRLAIEHELLLKQPARAKALLYRAIKACPWSKNLYLLPFGPLRESFTARELEEVADLMANRKVRIRVGMESFLETWRGEGESEEDEDGRALEGEMGEDERLLVRAQEERARLMPY